MKRFWTLIGLLGASFVLIVAGAMFIARPAGIALASAPGANPPVAGPPWAGGVWHAGPWGGTAGFALPPELEGLASVPADQRFGHFVGAQVSLKDRDGHPLVVTATPGTVDSASATSLTIAANDGATKTFALNDQTMVHGARKSGGSANRLALASGDAVVVVTLNQSTTATAVIDGGTHAFDWSGPSGSAH